MPDRSDTLQRVSEVLGNVSYQLVIQHRRSAFVRDFLGSASERTRMTLGDSVGQASNLEGVPTGALLETFTAEEIRDALDIALAEADRYSAWNSFWDRLTDGGPIPERFQR